MPGAIDVFGVHGNIMGDYKSFIKSFMHIKDDRIRQVVETETEKGYFWPDPLIQFNPSYEITCTTEDLCEQGLLRPQLMSVFPDYRLYRHQVRAIELGTAGRDFVVTSGTGSGKSLTYMATIFDHLFSQGQATEGVKALIVYPMNALINSQGSCGGTKRQHSSAIFRLSHVQGRVDRIISTCCRSYLPGLHPQVRRHQDGGNRS